MTPEDIVVSVETSRDYFNRSTRMLSEANSSFAPAPGTFTAAAQIAHAAQSIDWFFNGAFAEGGFDLNFEQSDKDVRACTSLDAARAWFNAATDRAKTTAAAHSAEEWASPLPEGPIMGGLPRFSIVNAVADHTAHHRGALTVYTRLLGMVPPMPYMEM